MNGKYTCCFIGHREIVETDELKERLYKETEKLIVCKNVHTFLFGSKSRFNDLCYQTVTCLKEKYPYIKRVYVRAEYPYINDNYLRYLLCRYEETYYPDKILNAGRARYVERNYEMIDKSEFCIIYYDENYLPPRKKQSKHCLSEHQPKSGTKILYDYAVKKKIKLLNILKD